MCEVRCVTCDKGTFKDDVHLSDWGMKYVFECSSTVWSVVRIDSLMRWNQLIEMESIN
jgi:hypothetical protein